MASEICMMCRPFLGTTGFHPDCAWHGTKAQERNTRPATAATDTGLETVARQYRWGGDPKWKPFGPIFDDEPRETRELCLRSQAAKLLAAERAEKEKERLRFEGDLDKWMKIIGAGITGYQPEAYALMDLACEELVKLRAENAAQAARIKELEADRDHQSKLSNKLNRSHAALEARLAAAHEALEFYANTDNWKNGRFEQAEGGTVLQHYPSSAHKDRGATARAVLGGKP